MRKYLLLIFSLTVLTFFMSKNVSAQGVTTAVCRWERLPPLGLARPLIARLFEDLVPSLGYDVGRESGFQGERRLRRRRSALDLLGA